MPNIIFGGSWEIQNVEDDEERGYRKKMNWEDMDHYIACCVRVCLLSLPRKTKTHNKIIIMNTDT